MSAPVEPPAGPLTSVVRLQSVLSFDSGEASPADIDTALARLAGADRNAFPLFLAAPIAGAAPLLGKATS